MTFALAFVIIAIFFSMGTLAMAATIWICIKLARDLWWGRR